MVLMEQHSSSYDDNLGLTFNCIMASQSTVKSRL